MALERRERERDLDPYEVYLETLSPFGLVAERHR